MISNDPVTTVDLYRDPLLVAPSNPVLPVYHEFTEGDTVLSSRSESLPYRRRVGEKKRNAHWGQRKLLLTEIQFFTRFWDSARLENATVVYAGAAPGIHIPALPILFPGLTFHCYDPRPFLIPSSPQIILHQELFTDDIARQWAGRRDVFFLSDIRCMGPKCGTPDEVEEGVIKDMVDQERWVRIMSPLESLLKFRLPYLTTRRVASDRIVGTAFRYLQGHVFLQPWTGPTSAEARLVPTVPYTLTDWDVPLYENRFFFYNSESREKRQFLNPVTNDPRPLDPPELISDADSTLEGRILADYVTKYLVEGETLDPLTVIEISRLLTTILNADRTPSDPQYRTLAITRNRPVRTQD